MGAAGQPQIGVESVRRSLARLGALLWLIAVALAVGGAVGGMWVADIAHPIRSAPSVPAAGIAHAIQTVPSDSAPTGFTHPYVTLGVAIAFVGVVIAAAVGAVAWALRHADSPRR